MGTNEGIIHEARYCTMLSVTASCSLKPCHSFYFWDALCGCLLLSDITFCPLGLRSALCCPGCGNPFSITMSNTRRSRPDRWDGIPLWDRDLLYEFGSLWDCIALSMNICCSLWLWDSALLSAQNQQHPNRTAHSKTHFLKKSPIVRYISVPWMFRSFGTIILKKYS